MKVLRQDNLSIIADLLDSKDIITVNSKNALIYIRFIVNGEDKEYVFDNRIINQFVDELKYHLENKI